ncbi:hypothetical protein KC333_g153 [Hortaea werneckii]|nr:hypothetical protein KC333_g153 [Hortaea werneckii]
MLRRGWRHHQPVTATDPLRTRNNSAIFENQNRERFCYGEMARIANCESTACSLPRHETPLKSVLDMNRRARYSQADAQLGGSRYTSCPCPAEVREDHR